MSLVCFWDSLIQEFLEAFLSLEVEGFYFLILFDQNDTKFLCFLTQKCAFWLDVVKILVIMLESIAATLGGAEARVSLHGSAI